MITGEMFHEYCEMSQWIPPFVQFQTSTNCQSITILPVAETPITNADDGKRREVDDCHPRARSQRVHKKNEISIIEDNASVQTFCNRYIVEESLVKKYLEHLNHLEIMSEKRKKQEFEREHNVL